MYHLRINHSEAKLFCSEKANGFLNELGSWSVSKKTMNIVELNGSLPQHTFVSFKNKYEMYFGSTVLCSQHSEYHCRRKLFITIGIMIPRKHTFFTDHLTHQINA